MKKNILLYLTPKSETFYLLANSTIRQALEKFDFHKFSVVPLIDKNGKYYGTISEGDILRYIKNECDFDIHTAEKQQLSKIEKYRSYKAISINASMDDVLKLAIEQNFIPIKDDLDNYIGIIKRKDIIKDAIENKLYEI